MRQVRRLGRRVGHQQRRLMQRALPWRAAVDQRRRWELQQLRRLAVQVQAHRRRRRRLAGLPGRLWLITVDRRLRQLVRRMRRPRARERLRRRLLRSQVRLLEQRWCTLEAASRRRPTQLGKRLARLEDLLRLRHRLQRLLSVTRTRGIVGTTRVLLKVGLRPGVAGALWCTTRRAWVLPPRRQEARPVTRVRRLAGKRCEVVRARLTRPRQQVWLRVRWW